MPTRVRAHPVGYPVKPPLELGELVATICSEAEADTKIATHETGTRHRWTLDKLRKGAGLDLDPTEIAVPIAGSPDMLLTYIMAGTAVLVYTEEQVYWAICFPDTYTDLAIQTYCGVGGIDDAWITRGRMADPGNHYYQLIKEAAGAADHKLRKNIANTITDLAVEAVDVTATHIRSLKLSCLGSDIKAYRANLVTAKLSAADTALTSGYFGVGQTFASPSYSASPEVYLLAKKVAAGSPSPPPIGYFESPIIGSGKREDPYRVKMPEFIETHPIFGNTNRLALTHSSLIPSDERGQPLHSKTLVRVFVQPNRQTHLNPEAACITELKAQTGVTEITKVNVKARAKGMDTKLKDEDLTPDTGWE